MKKILSLLIIHTINFSLFAMDDNQFGEKRNFENYLDGNEDENEIPKKIVKIEPISPLPNEIWVKIIKYLSINDRQSLKHTNKFFHNSFEKELSIKYELIYDIFSVNDGNYKTVKLLRRIENLNFMPVYILKKIRYLKLDGGLYKNEIKNGKAINTAIKQNLDASIDKMNNLIFIDLTDTEYTPTNALIILNKLKKNKKIVIIIKLTKDPKAGFFKNLNKLIEKNKDVVIVIQKEDPYHTKYHTIFSYDNKMPAWLSNY